MTQNRRRAFRTALAPWQRWHGRVRAGPAFHFSVHDFCATGLGIVARGHHVLLPVGRSFVASLRVPEVQGDVWVELTVCRVFASESLVGPQVGYGLQLRPKSKRARVQWSCALLRHGKTLLANVTPVTLAREGFEVLQPARALHFRTAKTAADWDKVHQLRFRSYEEAGLLQTHHQSMADMRCPLDARGQVVVGYHGQQAVATVRLLAPQVGDRIGLDDWLDSHAALPPLDTVVEVARLAVHPDFRGQDMLPTLCQYMARFALAHGRRYLLFGTNRKLAAYYRRFGGRDTGIGGSYCGAPAKVVRIDLPAMWLAGDALQRRALFAKPPPLDGRPVRMPCWRTRPTFQRWLAEAAAEGSG